MALMIKLIRMVADADAQTNSDDDALNAFITSAGKVDGPKQPKELLGE